MVVDIGAMTREFILQRPSGIDGEGYDDVETIWGAMRYASGSELLRFGTPVATSAYVVTIWFRDDLEASWRLADPASGSPMEAWQISSFGDPDGKREQLNVYCTALQ